ncbi:MAG: alpha/beta hydrolase [Rhodospirillaceae bacterium]|jgi:acetyl esterase|nr:alpha/beta hydrolase [Rhodospirillaceae bacterium]MBT4770949.1 alpha/beta hydrolase [Rhodospirillaceae bacterium]MBT5359256.1 alpha/beta hydrolase [Rhodospirillaceae bacterium]MBT5769125.1 alpha/beta hydrolase [Rhodospirillaceae bacterium]MBT6310523.1 alpha/beta hydrolase [Rhodospirillaceae bacterium]
MYIDPQIKTFIDGLVELNMPHPVDLGIEGARDGFSQLWQQVNPPSRDSVKVEDIQVPGPSGDIRTKVYTPAGDGPFPVLAFFHGGGCCMMAPEDYDGTNTALAEDAGCIVVVPAYRRAPENPFPAPLEDCFAVFTWLQSNAGEIGGDSNRIAIAGDSGGGYLAAAVAQEAKRKGAPQPLTQILMYPMTDMGGLPPSRVEETMFLDDRTLQWVIGMHVGEHRLDPRASPILEPDVSGLAPALVIAAQIDPLRDEGRAYASKLQNAGVPVQYQLYDGVVHGFFNMGGFCDQGNIAVAQVADTLKKAFAKG